MSGKYLLRKLKHGSNFTVNERGIIFYKTPMNGVLRNHKLGSKISSHIGNFDS